jgi:hypothetical protein
MTMTLPEESLLAHRAALAARLQETEAELRRVNAALRALGEAPAGTLVLLRACVASERETDAEAALAYLTAHGWQPDARGNPLNAVRSALAHLAERGEIQRVSRGTYLAVART